jgi:lipopolysaccharide transport system permease protein
MQTFSATPVEILSSLWRNRSLVKASIQREVLGRYRGSVMGILWSFINPLFMLIVYTFVFSVVFKARWSGGSESKTEFALVLFAGLLVFNLFAECINRAPGLIIGNQNYVKKVVYPLEILPWVGLGAAIFHGAVSLGVWLIVYMIFFGAPHTTIIYLPFILLPFFFFIMGLSWALASLGVYLRDVGQFVGLLTTVLMFVSPIFYPASSLPETYSKYLYLNPITLIIEQVRDVLFWGRVPNFTMLGIYLLVMSSVAWLGFAWFQKTRKGFADVL